MTSENIPPTQKALQEALELSSEVLRNVELMELPLVNIALKVSRIARLLNEYEVQKIMEYEASGYPTTPDGVHPEIYKLAVTAGREYQTKDNETKENKKFVFLESIEELEHETRIAEAALQAAKDADKSVSSSNPYQTVITPGGNWYERQQIREKSSSASKKLSSRRTLIYRYVLRKHYELKYSGIADDIFSRVRERVNKSIGDAVPEATQKLSAVYENLKSENPEDWSNAVHSCRRILQDLADSVFPAQGDIVKTLNGKDKTIKLGKDNFINRLIAFIEAQSHSGSFTSIVGSHLKYIGERLDSVFRATQKGSHDTIVTQEEADRYVVYTYLIVGDILLLKK